MSDPAAGSRERGAAPAATPAPGRRAEALVAAMLLAGGAGLRIHGFADHALWIDEYGTAWAIAGGFGELWQRVIAVQGQSPLYYALVALSDRAFGGGVLALRLPSLVCGIALLGLALPLARVVLRDRLAALGTLAALAVNERLVFYAQEARPYALALLLTLASFLCFVQLLDAPPRRRWWLGWVASAVALFYAHYLFAIALGVQALYLVAHPRRVTAAWRPWLLGGGAIAVLCTPGLVQLRALADRRESLDWLATPGGVLDVLVGYLDLPLLGATTVASAGVAWAAGALRWPAPRALPGLVLLWLVVPFGLIALLPPLLGVNLSHRRYLLVALPAVALLYGLVLALPARVRGLRWLPLAGFVVAAFALRLLPTYQSFGLFSQRYWTERWDRASLALLHRQGPGEPVLYQTNFVELDAVVRGEADPYAVEFTTWPLAAHLPPQRRTALEALPFSDTPEMRAVLRVRLAAAARRPRTWVVAMPPAIGRVAQEVKRQPQLAIAAHERFGKVHLLLLRGDAQ